MQAQLAQFHALLYSDPTAAEQKALETPSGWAKQDQLAALARHHLARNPEKARSFALLLLQQKGNLFDRSLKINSPGSSLSLNSSPPPSKSLLEDLISADAPALMSSLVKDEQVTYANQHELAHYWAKQNLEEFAQWVEEEAPPEARKLSAQTMTNILSGRKRFDEAIEWANDLPASSGHLSLTYFQWLQSDPEAARSWRKEASLNEEKASALDQSEELVRSIQ